MGTSHGNGAGDGPEHETARDREDIDDDHVFECRGVEEKQPHLRRRNSGEPGGSAQAAPIAPAIKMTALQAPASDIQLSRRNRSGLFQGMTPIGLAIPDVVEEIRCAGQCAEDRESCQSSDDRAGFQQSAAEQQTREKQQILRPLLGTQRRREERRVERRTSRRDSVITDDQTLAEEAKLRTASASLS